MGARAMGSFGAVVRRAWVVEGLDDDVRALDTEALGIMFLQSLGQTGTAGEVLAYTQSALGSAGGPPPSRATRRPTT
jgi:hypothetical protein